MTSPHHADAHGGVGAAPVTRVACDGAMPGPSPPGAQGRLIAGTCGRVPRDEHQGTGIRSHDPYMGFGRMTKRFPNSPYAASGAVRTSRC